MEFVPVSLWLSILFVFGIIIGSFLNVVIYRLHTGKSINDRSHCLSCGNALLWYELFPILSYLFLLGRCRSCGAYIPLRYLFVEMITGFLFVMVGAYTEDILMLVLLCSLLSVLVVGVVYDLYHMIIPNEIAFSVAGVSLSIIGYQSFLANNYSILFPALLSGFCAFVFFAGLWKFSKGAWIGFADAKLSFGLALLLSLSQTFSFVVLSFWVGAALSILIISIQRLSKRGKVPLLFFGIPLTMKSEIPFAPFLVVAFVLVYFYSVDVLSLTSYAIEKIIS